jgi:hypothetical protein
MVKILTVLAFTFELVRQFPPYGERRVYIFYIWRNFMKKFCKKTALGAAIIAACLTFILVVSGCGEGMNKGADENLMDNSGYGTDIAYTAKGNGNLKTPTTKINFVFRSNVAGLKAADIVFEGRHGAATAGALTGSGRNWSLGVTVTKQGSATVYIDKDGIDGGVKGISLYMAGGAAPNVITYDAEADGGGLVLTSTKIDFEFSADVPDLTVGDIKIEGIDGTGPYGRNPSLTAPAPGDLTKIDNRHYSLNITVTTAGSAEVSISKAGIDSAERGITLCYDIVRWLNDQDFGYGVTPDTTQNANANFDLETYLKGLGAGKHVVNLTGDPTPFAAAVSLPSSVHVSLRAPAGSSHTISLGTASNMFNFGGDTILSSWGPVLQGKNAGMQPVVLMQNGGEFRFHDGEIKGHTNSKSSNCYGGGVGARNGAKFIMTGGSITGNSATGNGQGGGVYLEGSYPSAISEFTMSGGSITGNSHQGRPVGVFGTYAIFIRTGGAVDVIAGNNWQAGSSW